MTRTDRGGRRGTFTALLAALAALVLVLAACGSSGSAPQADPGAADGGENEAPADGGGTDGRGIVDDGTGTDDGYAALVEQRIVKTGEITLEVDNVGQALGRIRALATELGGYVGGSQAGTLDESATLTLRIPADRFDEALDQLHEMDAEVVAEATREEDVTSQIVDLQARIENLEASEATYRDLVARATKIEDILAVQTRLDQVRGEIEQMRAQLEAVSGRADLSTLTVSVVPAAAPVAAQSEEWDPGAQFDAAVAALLGVGQGLVTALIWVGVVIVPIGLVVGLLAIVLLRGGLEVRRRTTPVAGPEDVG